MGDVKMLGQIEHGLRAQARDIRQVLDPPEWPPPDSMQDDRLRPLPPNTGEKHQLGQPCPVRIEPDSRAWSPGLGREPVQTRDEDLNALK